MSDQDAGLAEDLRRATRALELAEQIPPEPWVPNRDLLLDVPGPPEPGLATLGREALAFERYVRTEWLDWGRVAASFRLEHGTSELEMRHTMSLSVRSWANTSTHPLWRRRLIRLLEDVRRYLRNELGELGSGDSVTRRGERGRRRSRSLARWEGLHQTEQAALRLLACQSPGERQKGAAIASELGVAVGTAKRHLSGLVKAGYLESSRNGYAFRGWPEGSPDDERGSNGR